MFICYLITNTANGKRYVGVTKNTAGWRWTKHKEAAKAGKGFLLHTAMRKYGIEAFTFETVKTNIPKEEIETVEQTLIEQYNTFEVQVMDIILLLVVKVAME